MSEIEGLLRKELRSAKLLNPKKQVILLGKGTVEHAVAKHLLNHIFNGRIEIVSVSSTKKRTNVFRPTNLEQELVLELRGFLEDHDMKTASPPIMASIPEAEILAYARRTGLNGKPLRNDKLGQDVRLLLERLQREQPQTKACLRKSFDHLRTVPKKTAKPLSRQKRS